MNRTGGIPKREFPPVFFPPGIEKGMEKAFSVCYNIKK